MTGILYFTSASGCYHGCGFQSNTWVQIECMNVVDSQLILWISSWKSALTILTASDRMNRTHIWTGWISCWGKAR